MGTPTFTLDARGSAMSILSASDLLVWGSTPQSRTGVRTTRTMRVEDQAADADAEGGAAIDAVTDEDLMLRFRDGDAAAFEQLVARHKKGLYNFLLRSVHNPSRAEELLQEVFVRVIRAKDRYQRTARFTTWVYTIARNLCVDEARRQRFRKTVPLEAKRRGRDDDPSASVLDVTAAAQVGTDVASEAPTVRARVAAAIENLPDDQREVFMLRQFGGLSFKQIGEAVGAPENTVKSRMRYALDKLREELRDIDPRPETTPTAPAAPAAPATPLAKRAGRTEKASARG